MLGQQGYIHLATKPSTTHGAIHSHSNPLARAGAHRRANGFITKIDFNFRTRKANAEMVRIMGPTSVQHPFAVVQIKSAKLTFHFNPHPGRWKAERELSIESVDVNDGHWHRVVAHRYGQSTVLTLDNGGLGKTVWSTVLDERDDEDTHHSNTIDAPLDADQPQIILGGHWPSGSGPTLNDFANGNLHCFPLFNLFAFDYEVSRWRVKVIKLVMRPCSVTLAVTRKQK